MTSKILSQARLKELLHYNMLTGVFTRKIRTSNAIKVGDNAGYINTHGYRYIRVNSIRYKASRLAFLYVTGNWPPDQVDHINHQRDNNSWKNLRQVRGQENGKNQSLSIRNTSGVVGVYWNKCDKKWQAQIVVNGKHIYLGRFNNIEDAKCARLIAEDKHGFHTNHGKTTQ